MKHILYILLLMSAISVAFSQEHFVQDNLVRYVNPLIGTAHSTTSGTGRYGKGSEEMGQTIPAVTVPNGMNFWTPQTRQSEKKCVAPYYYEDDIFLGFRNSHWINGGCTQDYGSMTITPQFENLRTSEDKIGTHFTHSNEIAQANYYSVMLEEEHIRAEMTGRSRTAIFRFTYKEQGRAYIVVSSNSDERQGTVKFDKTRNCIYGQNPVHKIYQGKGESAGFSSWFIVQFPKTPVDCGEFKQGGWFAFEVSENDTLVVKASSSFCDLNGARQNMDAEIPHWDFNRTLTETTNDWNRQLGLIEIDSWNQKDKEIFYTALWHASLLPRCISDMDGRRPRFDNGSQTSTMLVKSKHPYYTDFSLWDTYRALHPLLNIISPEKNGQMIQSLVDMYSEGGWIPIFPCWNSYTCAMIGDHALSAITDAYIKGVRNFDIQKAYEGMRKNAFEIPQSEQEYRDGHGRRALKSYMNFGYIPLEDNVNDAYHKAEQVSRTLEYAYDDWCLSQMALALNKKKDYKMLIKRSENYRNVINPKTGYAQGRYKNKKFSKDVSPFSLQNYITEGAPCHYTWYVPHDPDGLIGLLGGRNRYLARLDSMFSQKLYWHGNEPCHQVAYMYVYAGVPQKTQKEVHNILRNEYNNGPGGLPGNEDAGQMSAWYVFSSLGFYPVCPGSPDYIIGAPLFPYAKIHLFNGKTFEIRANNLSEDNIYIQSMRFNGQPYTNYHLTNDMIINGGLLEFEMGPTAFISLQPHWTPNSTISSLP